MTIDRKNQIKFESNDHPIKTIQDDQLNRAEFSKKIADAISNSRNEERSIVIALNGKWGSGKSSIKNMIIDNLQKDYNSIIDRYEFSPWQWTGQEHITQTFFTELSNAIGKHNKEAQDKKLIKKLRKYGLYLQFGESISTGFNIALPYLFGFSSLIAFSDVFIQDQRFKILESILLILSAGIAGGLKFGNKFLNSIIGKFKAISEDSKLSLEELKIEIKHILKFRSKSILVVLDDLDRLTSNQLKIVFQLIKANSDFPNMIFLILYQKDLVESKMTDEGGQSGRNFLEKIIQVPIDIPKAEKYLIKNILIENIESTLNTYQSEYRNFDKAVYEINSSSAFLSYFNNLRDVHRFSTTLNFHFNLLKSGANIEVNPIDLIFIECLRVFDYDVYTQIHNFREELIFKKNADLINNEIDESLIKLITEKSNNKDNCKDLLKILFPKLREQAINTKSNDATKHTKGWHLCSPEYFDKYFQFSIPNGEISHNLVEKFLKLSSDSDSLFKYFLELESQNLEKKVIFQVTHSINQYPEGSLETFFFTIAKIRTRNLSKITYSSNTKNHILGISNLLFEILENIISKIPLKKEKARILLRCMDDINLLSFSGDFLTHPNLTYDTGHKLFSHDSFSYLKMNFIEKLELIAKNESKKILNHPDLSKLLNYWKIWGDITNIKEWVNQNTNTNKELLIMLKSFIVYPDIIDINIPAIQTNLIDLNNYMSFKSIRNKINSINDPNLSIHDKEIFDFFLNIDDDLLEKEIKQNNMFSITKN